MKAFTIAALALALLATPVVAQDHNAALGARVREIQSRLAAERDARILARYGPPLPHLPAICEKQRGDGGPHPQCKGELTMAMHPTSGDPQVVQAILATYPEHAAEMTKMSTMLLRMDAERAAYEAKFGTHTPRTWHTICTMGRFILSCTTR